MYSYMSVVASIKRANQSFGVCVIYGGVSHWICQAIAVASARLSIIRRLCGTAIAVNNAFCRSTCVCVYMHVCCINNSFVLSQKLYEPLTHPHAAHWLLINEQKIEKPPQKCCNLLAAVGNGILWQIIGHIS